MTRIGSTGLGGLDLLLQNSVSRTLNRLGNSGTRLATLSQINRAADNPAGLISLDSLRAELTALEQADRNASRAASAVRVADSGLSQVSSILNDIRGAIVASSGNLVSNEQLAANQTIIDAGLNALNRIGATSAFNGVSLLDGSGAFTASGVNPSQIIDLEVLAASGGAGQQVSVEVTQAAGSAEFVLTASPADLAAEVALLVSGTEGLVTLEFSAGSSASDIAQAINATTESTGVSATVDGEELTLNSVGVGSGATVSVEVLEGSLSVADALAVGTDVQVTVAGETFTGSGNQVQIRTDQFSADITFADKFTGQVDTLTVEGEALTFLFAPNPDSTVSISLPQISTSALGGAAGRLSDLASGGSASLASGNFSGAIEILDAASSQVTEARARLGAFEKFTIESSRQVVQAAQFNISEAISQIGDTDIAAESAMFIRQQILAKTGLAALKIGSDRRNLIANLLEEI